MIRMNENVYTFSSSKFAVCGLKFTVYVGFLVTKARCTKVIFFATQLTKRYRCTLRVSDVKVALGCVWSPRHPVLSSISWSSFMNSGILEWSFSREANPNVKNLQLDVLI